MTGAGASVPVLETRGLTKHYPVTEGRRRRWLHAVDDLDLTLHAGEIVALVGESGSGKSTVAKLLSRLVPSTSGQILRSGEAAKARRGRRFREHTRHIQLIFQDPFSSLNPLHKVGYVLRRSVAVHRPELDGAAREDAVGSLLERVRLTPPERYLDKFPHELSGGQRQRVAIARALGADPAVLLADEPVSMLDVSIRLGVLNLLRDLRDTLDVAILYITHDIASARYFADRTLVMYAGQVVEQGDSEAVTQTPAHPYTRLLIGSAPDPENRRDPQSSPVTPGEPPNLVTPPPGCRFHARCPLATALCVAQPPPVVTIAAGRSARCWVYAPDTPGAPVDTQSTAASS